jgi:hypothetical protein
LKKTDGTFQKKTKTGYLLESWIHKVVSTYNFSPGEENYKQKWQGMVDHLKRKFHESHLESEKIYNLISAQLGFMKSCKKISNIKLEGKEN